MAPIKIERERDGALALGGRYSIGEYNISSRGGVEEETQLERNVW